MTLFSGKREHRVVVVTGGGGGIGSAMAREFCALGDHVVVCDVCLDRAKEVARELGGFSLEARELDVADEQQVGKLFDDLVETYGAVDVLCNNAGIGCWTSLENTTTSAWDRTLAVNLRGMFLCSRAVAPGMRQKGMGSIINTASVHSFQSWPECSAYAASKGAVLAFTRSIGLELIPYGIRVNAIAPGTTDTRMLRLSDTGVPISEAELAEEVGRVPAGRAAAPAEIARVAVFLASDSASFMVGSCVVVDGGSTAKL